MKIMKELEKFCKQDDTCIFIILILIGFLLCMFFNRDEGFLDFSYVNESEDSEKDNHDYGGIGKEPSQNSMGKKSPPPDKPVGLFPRNPGEQSNINPEIIKKLQMARQGNQYQPNNINNKSGLNKMDSSLDRNQPLGVPANYSFMTQFAKFKIGGPSESQSDLGPLFPKGEPSVPSFERKQMDVDPSTIKSTDSSENLELSADKKEMKLVLFYAPWCGHSKNMLGDYDSVIQKYDNSEMNGVKLSIIKVDMEQNKDGAKSYGVDVKGFPTLYTFIEQNSKLISQPFSQRDETGIVQELQKRTKSLSN